MKEYQFKEGFLWGGACSAVQCEGRSPEDGKQDNIWDQWYREDPGAFYQGVGPEVTSDFYHNYEQLIKMMRECGITSFRTSLQWARIISDRDGTVNRKGIGFYHRVIDALLDKIGRAHV